MRGMNSETVDLIATDPPFNKSRDFHATPDSLAKGAKFQDRWSWEKDVHQEWVEQITDDYPKLMEAIKSARFAHSDGMGAFMCFMAVRLLEMRRILKPTGSIYLHCDPTASHYLKAVMDSIFDWKNFQNEFIWYYSGGGASKKRWARKHDIILFYTKGKKWIFNADMVRVPYKWTDGQKRADGSERDYKRGKLPDDVLEYHSLMPWSKEHTGYPTQKPLFLYEKFIKASSNCGDVVLDPFCGCATTCVAAERTRRQWVGIDIWDGAHELVLDRIKREGLAREGEDSYMLFTDESFQYRTDVPVRDDEGEDSSVAYLETPYRRNKPAWEKLLHPKMKEILGVAQDRNKNGLIECAGCGRDLEKEFMQLDHVNPRRTGGRNTIDNRVLLCGPCNRRKGALHTMFSLWKENEKEGWMQDRAIAEYALKAAQAAAEKQKVLLP